MGAHARVPIGCAYVNTTGCSRWTSSQCGEATVHAPLFRSQARGWHDTPVTLLVQAMQLFMWQHDLWGVCHTASWTVFMCLVPLMMLLMVQ